MLILLESVCAIPRQLTRSSGSLLSSTARVELELLQFSNKANKPYSVPISRRTLKNPVDACARLRLDSQNRHRQSHTQEQFEEEHKSPVLYRHHPLEHAVSRLILACYQPCEDVTGEHESDLPATDSRPVASPTDSVFLSILCRRHRRGALPLRCSSPSCQTLEDQRVRDCASRLTNSKYFWRR